MAKIWTMGEILVEIMRPRAGIPLSEKGEFIGPFPSGAPAIFIDTVSRLGHSAAIIGGVGDDDFGRIILDRLKRDGVNCRQIKIFNNGATAVAFVSYFEDGSRRFIFHIEGTPAVMAEFDNNLDIGDSEFFHVMGCSLMANINFRKSIFKAVESFHNQGSAISFDPNIRPELLGDKDLMDVIGPVLKRTRVLLTGEAELELITAVKQLKDSVRKVFDNYPVEIIVLKKGRKGASIYSLDEQFDIKPYKVVEVDPTGAGDCFDAAFLCGLLEGKPLAECGKMAAAVGALNASAQGPMGGDISQAKIKEMVEGVV